MLEPSLRLALCALLCAVAGACSTPAPSDASPVLSFAVESRGPIELRSGADRVALWVEGESTVLLLDDLRVVFSGRQGWIGRVAVAGGSLRVGSVMARWDEEALGLGTRDTWQSFPRHAQLSLYVEQDGRVGRNVFRAGS